MNPDWICMKCGQISYDDKTFMCWKCGNPRKLGEIIGEFKLTKEECNYLLDVMHGIKKPINGRLMHIFLTYTKGLDK